MLRQHIGSYGEDVRTSGGVTAADAAIDGDAVRLQLERLIRDPLFRQSRRYSGLLRYLVEETLRGHSNQLKERTVGVDVFGREPAYDTNLDPVVRTTAAQLRHRIARYYSKPGSDFEIRIALPPGAYVPEFLRPLGLPPSPAEGAAIHREDVAVELPASSVQEPCEVPAIAAPALIGSRTMLGRWFAGRNRRLAIGIGMALAASLSVAAVAMVQSPHKDPSLRSFWDPVWDTSGSVLLCIGDHGWRPGSPTNNSGVSPVAAPASGAAAASPTNPGPTVKESLGADSVAWPDAIVLAELSGLSRASGQSLRLRRSSLIAFVDLRDSPLILVGGFNNQWIMRLGKSLRFRFVADRATDNYWIQDQQHPEQQTWLGHMNAQYSGFATDYGLITRVRDQSLDKTVVIASGIAAYGTMAAAEFLTSEKYMKMVADRAPKGWEHKNVQVVISTEVIGGNAGPPRILSTYFW